MIQEKDIRTFDDFAQWKSTDPDDRFALRVLKNLVTDLINSPNLGNVHRALTHPRSSGSDDWDRIICGAASMFPTRESLSLLGGRSGRKRNNSLRERGFSTRRTSQNGSQLTGETPPLSSRNVLYVSPETV